MKRFLSVLISLVMLLSVFGILPVSAASDFEIDNGILLSYNGTDKVVSIPEDVYFIADSAFSGNKSITTVKLNLVSSIGNMAFYGCSSLKSVTDSAYVTSCGAYAFEGTPFLKDNSDSTIVLGSALISCKEKGNVAIPDEVTSISPYSFKDNTSITSVALGDKVVELGEGAFYGCSSLSSVSVSDNLSYVGAFAFEGTPWLSAQTADYVVIGNDVLIDANISEANLVIPENVRYIAAGVFYQRTNLKTVSLPSELSGIGMRAFGGCTSLASVSFPESLRFIDSEAFYGCKNLKTVTVPSTVTLLGDSVFLGCTGLSTVRYYSDADLSTGMFAGCSSLKSVMLSSDTRRIEDYAFYGCSSLNEISVPDSVRLISTTAFMDSNEITVYCNKSAYAYSRLDSLGITVHQIGDATLDTDVNVRDSTYIQKALVGLVSLNFSAELRSDVNFDGVVNVRDATQIQKMVAGLI